ncbi:MAG: nucleotidyl transferase AbiEii/AbiGii toxin family protein [bacterium]
MTNSKNISASIRAKLRNKAMAENKPFQEILQYYGMERFIYRLSVSKYRHKFVLKGALILYSLDVNERRATMDIDFSFLDVLDIDSLKEMIKEICVINIDDDGIMFDPDSIRIQAIRQNINYEGLRVKFTGYLDKAKIPIQLDMSFRENFSPEPIDIYYPAILKMTGPILKGYRIETVISEKFEAMIKLGSINSRMKDFYDIWLLINQFEIDKSALKEAIHKTFQFRETVIPTEKPFFDKDIYDDNSDRQILWRTFINKNHLSNAPDTLGTVACKIEDFLSPILKKS